MIFNQIASGGGGGGLDTFDATAYPEHLMEGYTAYARGMKITGTLSTKEVPVILASNSVDVASGTSLSITIEAKIEKVVVLAVAARDDITAVSSGWTRLVESPHIIDSTYEQRNYIYYKIATSTTEIVTVTQASSSRLYLTALSFDTSTVPKVDTSMSVLSPELHFVEYLKPLDKTYIVVASSNYWGTSSPYQLWETSPTLYKAFQLCTHTQNRLLVCLDDDTPVLRTLSNNLTGTGDDRKISMCAVYF